jgi:hypothetical protein
MNGESLVPQRLVDSPECFDAELAQLLLAIEGGLWEDIYEVQNKFLSQVVWPMHCAHRGYREGKKDDTITNMEHVTAPDWQLAGREWLERRGAF